MRWLSPPERVAEARERVRYSRPTLFKKPSRALISLRIWEAIMASRSERERFSTKARASVTDILQKSLMLSPPTVTARYSFLSRSPLQSGQGTALMTWVISSRI